MTITEIQNKFINEFSNMEDWITQYSYLMEAADYLDDLDDQEKTGANQIYSCQFNTWVVVYCDEGKIRIKADSDALIIKGVLGIIVEVLSGHSPQEVMEADIYFIEKTALKEQLSLDIQNGIKAVVARIKQAVESNIKQA